MLIWCFFLLVDQRVDDVTHWAVRFLKHSCGRWTVHRPVLTGVASSYLFNIFKSKKHKINKSLNISTAVPRHVEYKVVRISFKRFILTISSINRVGLIEHGKVKVFSQTPFFKHDLLAEGRPKMGIEMCLISLTFL